LGVDARSVAKALSSGYLSLDYLENSALKPPPSEHSFSELAAELAIPFSSLEKLYIACGLGHPSPDELVRDQDVPIIRAVPILFGARVSAAEVLRAVRVWAESARRVAQYQIHHFHNSIEEPFRQRGLSDNEALEAAVREVSVRLGHSGQEMLAWLYRRHSEAFTMQHLLEHVDTALEQAGVRPKPTRQVEAAVFADLSGYTRLTEESGDEAAAHVSTTLAQLVSEIAARHRGVVVKMLGDGVHFHFSDPGDAVLASLALIEIVRPRGLPPAHVGVEAGPMIYDEGDYFGRSVNMAARLASQAAADQVFVGEGLVSSVVPSGFSLVEVGAYNLKGFSRPVTIHEAIRRHDT
jgi:adenylate cyclase